MTCERKLDNADVVTSLAALVCGNLRPGIIQLAPLHCTGGAARSLRVQSDGRVR